MIAEIEMDDIRMMLDPKGIERWGPAQERAERVRDWALSLDDEVRLCWNDVRAINAAAQCLFRGTRLPGGQYTANGTVARRMPFSAEKIRRIFE